MKKYVTAALLVACSLPLRPRSTEAGFILAGSLRNGQPINGTVQTDALMLAITTADGRTVDLTVGKNPSWVSSDEVLNIEWLEERHIYVLRGLNWTGECVRLAGQWEIHVRDASPKQLLLQEARHLSISNSQRSR